MKKMIIIMVFLLGVKGFSQNKNAKLTLEVDGVCNMCKDRIEAACVKTKGIKANNVKKEIEALVAKKLCRLKLDKIS